MSSPTPADYANARALVAEMAETRCPAWIERNRDHLIRMGAIAAMQMRQHLEAKAVHVERKVA